MQEVDVVIVGGGAAGLWILDELVRAGYRALLVENRALGAGQTIQSQGIIHGGGKYALRGVRDLAAVAAIKDMPERWRAHLEGRRLPDLRAVEVRAPRTLMWEGVEGGMIGRLRRLVMPIVIGAGLLATRPERLAREQGWPAALVGVASRVYTMAEPVLATGSLLEALARPHTARVGMIASDEGTMGLELAASSEESTVAHDLVLRSPAGHELRLRARVLILAAGAGNGPLLSQVGVSLPVMQVRPLVMGMAKGQLPEVHGHWVQGGKTRFTITSAVAPDGERVWQIGGAIAEGDGADESARAAAMRDSLVGAFPALDWEHIQIATYRALRAEAVTESARRPSGVHLGEMAEGILAAWPTKLALVPLLAEAALADVKKRLGLPRASAEAVGFPPEWPRPDVAPYPWNDTTWLCAR